ncbi:hypothetical protein FB451DRAFT_1556794 [Mycena latifolia]|nr:hypothetical protein FB451DRAFT_1556794 [Mycena latifolia]
MASSLPSLDGTIGNAVIGVALSTFLYGIETLQTFNYYRDYPKDTAKLKLLVASTWLLELTQTILTWHAIYTMTVTFYGQPQHLAEPPLSLVLVILFSAMVNFVVQTFFAFRVRALSNRWPITIIVCILNLVRFIGNATIFGELWRRPEFSLLGTDLHWIFTASSAIGPFVDIITAGSLCYCLWHYKRSNFESTSAMIDTIVLWTVETTLITSLSGTMQLILFLTRNDFAWMIFYLMQAKLFANSMLASLNGRQRFRESVAKVQTGSHFLAFESAPQTRNTIHMTRIVETTEDDEGRISPPKQQISAI